MQKNVLILGGGGREFALYALIKKELEEKARVYILPGNGGVEKEDRILGVSLGDFPSIERIIREKEIEVVIVGPEEPLVKGVKDYLLEKNPSLVVIGPDKKGALLEGSKVFSYEFMQEEGIPCGRSVVVSSLEEGKKAIEKFSPPYVLKAEGLMAGKGVSIHEDRESALKKLEEIFIKGIYQEAGKRILVQEFLEGKESSLFALLNGEEALILPTARDYKRAYDGDKGPNTGGMGSYSPSDILNEEQVGFIYEKILNPVLKRFSYRGILYIGLMVHSSKREDISVLEFNVRLGDPEAQVILPRIEGKVLSYLLWTENQVEWVPKVKKKGYYCVPESPESLLNVVVSAKGYPLSYPKGIEISLPRKIPSSIEIFFAGVEEKNGKLLSSGGRILNVVGKGDTREEARQIVYHFLESWKKEADFSLLHYRKDIGL